MAQPSPKDFHIFRGSSPLYKSAVVAGATGATGRYIISHLLSQKLASKTIALTRRPLSTPAAIAAALDMDPSEVSDHLASGRLEVKEVDFDRLVQEKKPQWSADLAFCALGSAPFTEMSDYVVPVAFAEAALEGGSEYMGLVSSQGACSKSIVGYLSTLGRREDAFRSHNWPLGLGIWQVGMLDRGDKTADRLKERFMHWILPSKSFTDTRDLALAMVADAVRAKEQPKEAIQGKVWVYETGTIKKIIRHLKDQ